MKRKLAIGAAALLALAVLTVGVLLLRARSTLPATAGALTVPGLRAHVEVWRDSLGVPHVWAESERDLIVAQGFVHAQDRLWQMELLRRVMEGRLAEIFGPDLVPSDRFLRTLGLWRATAQAEAALDPASRALLQAYADGVNAWLRHADGGLPPEFQMLRIRPEPWTVRHTLGVEQVMSWDLAAYGASVQLARAIRLLGAERARWLAPDAPPWGATIVELPDVAAPAAALSLLEAFSITRASNAWVVGGARTRSGRPILANDMHLELRAPPIWYLMALHGGGYEVTGMTLPGAPLVIAGHTRAIAWGYTNANLDDADLFIERLAPGDSSRYLTADGAEPFEVEHDTIRVRRGEPVPIRIRRTRHGPVLPTERAEERGHVLALAWASHYPSRTFAGLRALNLARDWPSFLAAVADFESPHQNVVYADTAGRIAYVMAGRAPIRGDGRPAPLAPVPGWTGEWDWRGFAPFERHPRVVDPAAGYIVTANNRQLAGPEAAWIGSRWDEPFRALRIREMILGAAGPLDADAVHRMQLDVRDARADRYVDRAVAAAREAGLDAAADLLAGWDRRASTDSRAAALFYVWQEALDAALTEALYGGRAGWFPDDAVGLVLERRALPWDSVAGDVAYRSLAAAAMRRADSLAAGRAWGELNRLVISHALGEAGLLDRALGLNLGPAPRAGSGTTVNVSNHRGGAPPFTTTHGPSQRHVVDMGDVDGAGGFILPGGQSGIPYSKHYADQLEAWRGGGLWRIPLAREAAAARAVERLILRPAADVEQRNE